MGSHAGMSLRLAAAALVIAAAGCGGGGGEGGGGEPPSLPQPPGGPAAPGPEPLPQVLTWGSFPEARVVLGQQDMDDGDVPSDPHQLDRLDNPTGSPAVMGDGRLFVSSGGGIRLFRDYDAASGAEAEFEMTVVSRGLSSGGGRLARVAGNQVFIYNTAPVDGQASPDVVVGSTAGCAPTGLSQPQNAFLTPLGRLVVADTENHRVLVWLQIPEDDDQEPDFVVGQSLKDSCLPNFGSDEAAANSRTLRFPRAVWSDDSKLLVADSGNNRVLVYDFPAGNAPAATHVLGQSSFGNRLPNRGGQQIVSDVTLFNPTALDVRDTGQLAVADTGNNRVLIWDRFPAQPVDEPARQLMGQSGFTVNGVNAGNVTPLANTLNQPTGVRFDGRNLAVVDRMNHRVLVFRSTN